MIGNKLGEFNEYSQWKNAFKVALPEKLLWKGRHPNDEFQKTNLVNIWQISERVRSLKIQMSLADIIELMVENHDLKKVRLSFSLNENYEGSVTIEVDELVMTDDESVITFRGEKFEVIDGEIDQSNQGSDLMEILASDNCFTENTRLHLSQERIHKWIADGGDFVVLMELLEKEF
jgi:hypothetical protein